MNLRTIKLAGIIILSVSCLITIKASLSAAENKDAKEVIVAKEVEGAVSGLSPRFIAVETGLNSSGIMSEMAFNIDKNVTVSHKLNLSEIKMGDRVKLSYGEIYKEENGTRTFVRRQLLTIIFLQAAQAAPETEGKLQSAAAPSSDTASTAPQADMRLKGMKGE